jgi:PIN domain nuclease of toxin-antitoxin system
VGRSVIILDTHSWIWWVSEPERLTEQQRSAIASSENDSLGISAISCWEIAKLVERGRIDLDRDVAAWLSAALSYPGVRLIDLTPEIAVESTRLPGSFHRDPADQIIVATARALKCELVTSDQKILVYKHVRTIG